MYYTIYYSVVSTAYFIPCSFFSLRHTIMFTPPLVLVTTRCPPPRTNLTCEPFCPTIANPLRISSRRTSENLNPLYLIHRPPALRETELASRSIPRSQLRSWRIAFLHDFKSVRQRLGKLLLRAARRLPAAQEVYRVAIADGGEVGVHHGTGDADTF